MAAIKGREQIGVDRFRFINDDYELATGHKWVPAFSSAGLVRCEKLDFAASRRAAMMELDAVEDGKAESLVKVCDGPFDSSLCLKLKLFMRGRGCDGVGLS